MDTGFIIACLFIGMMFLGIIMFGIKSWQQRKDNQDIDLPSLGKIPGPGGLMDPGDPEMVTRLEKELKKEVRKSE